MITLQTDELQHHSASFAAAEQEAMTRLYELHARIMQAKNLLKYLQKSSCAESCLQKSAEKLLQMQAEARQWRNIRLQATKSRQVLSQVREEMATWQEIRRQASQFRQMPRLDMATGRALCPLDGAMGCRMHNQHHVPGFQGQPEL
ncbi:MAG: hypothetical protein H7835_00205 [Magnetococcus sp. XQGC-1]